MKFKHSLTVEAVMQHFAQLFNEPDEDKWRVIVLLHDIDFEIYPARQGGGMRRTESAPIDDNAVLRKIYRQNI
ncbi:hypothetical protein AXX12_15350 [Anaerosporomusa subterranea]|uniref:HD domain-containing protein n=1 Tax=Anaerosporomusa subterranea TaxID=1794912 RepID=A0A154BLV5_ANASB|nr:HD domain-containing protein [Anaerosporomusa subterranea]KYZ74954.1 hypothetical protein AXX12_15350 [Anaerosporomusa subterranea]